MLPLANLNGAPEHEYFSDGLADDIITELSRAKSFFVISRNSSFLYRPTDVDIGRAARELDVRYVLTGTVRRNADGLRVSTQLIGAENARILWADRFDRPLMRIFDLQDETACRVTCAVVPTVAAAELRRCFAR